MHQREIIRQIILKAMHTIRYLTTDLFMQIICLSILANEFIALDDLFRAAAIYAEAIYELIK